MNSIRLINVKLFFRNNKILAFLFLLSVVFTTAGVLSSSYSTEFYSLFTFNDLSFLSLWLRLSAVLVGYLLYNLISSFFMFGIVTSTVGVVVAFLGIGASSFATVQNFGLKGLLVNFLLMTVVSVFLTFFLIFTAKSMRMTLLMGQKLANDGGISTYSTELKRYFALFAVMVAVSLLASALIAGTVVLCTDVLNLI